MKANRTLAMMLALVCMAVTGVAQQRTDPTATIRLAAARTPPEEPEAKGLVLVDSERTAVGKQLAKTVGALVEAKDFDGLDKLADDLRQSKKQIADGTWHLLLFYRVLVFEAIDGTREENAAEATWAARMGFLKSWVSAKPTSITARVALARFLKEYAWKARGEGYAGTVSEQGWKLFAERLEQCRKILVEARNLPAKCPVWWDTLQYVGLGKGVNHASYNKVFDQAVAFEPGYTFFYQNKVSYLLPRGSGPRATGRSSPRKPPTSWGARKGTSSTPAWDGGRMNDATTRDS